MSNITDYLSKLLVGGHLTHAKQNPTALHKIVSDLLVLASIPRLSEEIRFETLDSLNFPAIRGVNLPTEILAVSLNEICRQVPFHVLNSYKVLTQKHAGHVLTHLFLHACEKRSAKDQANATLTLLFSRVEALEDVYVAVDLDQSGLREVWEVTYSLMPGSVLQSVLRNTSPQYRVNLRELVEHEYVSSFDPIRDHVDSIVSHLGADTNALARYLHRLTSPLPGDFLYSTFSFCHFDLNASTKNQAQV